MLDRNLESRRFHESESEWLRSFALDSVKCLVVCRGPVRKEVFDVFDEVGIAEYGMLLSEKDSVVYPRCLAPELRSMRFPNNVHRVPDYMGVGQEEKLERIAEIVEIAVSHGYTHIFAGYGFMAEDAEFIEAIEQAGVGFVGPASSVIRRAGAKDEAKKLARSLENAVIPGVDNISAMALLDKSGDRAALEARAASEKLEWSWDGSVDLAENAEALLQAGYAASIELVTIEELQKKAEEVCQGIWSEYPDNRIRFKHIGGGGGKGQRVVGRPEEIAAAVMDVLAEVKVLAPGSNRNFLIELNLESTRHNEIQLIGNGQWCLSLGGRDCSVQMHEQKLVEMSLTQELLDGEIQKATGRTREILEADKGCLGRMEAEGEKFGEATGLDSVSTFECIVEGANHFFMEMNTRIQVEHRVTELAYRLEFTNPDDPDESFLVESLVEAMLLLAVHGPRLPRPERLVRHVSGGEVRINATNAALQPHAGGMIKAWSPPLDYELRDDQGIGTRNPDTGAFVWYNLAGAYDSNIALVITDGESREENYQRLSEILLRTELRGDDLHTNLEVHYGLINWFLGKAPMCKPNTRFMTSYLAAVGALQAQVTDVDLSLAARELLGRMPDASARQTFAAKETLLLRPLEKLFSSPHGLGGFIGRFDGDLWTRTADGGVAFADNPVRFLHELYHYLHMEDEPGKGPSEKIWDHDDEILQAGVAFYAEIERRTGITDWSGIDALFRGPRRDDVADDDALWQACCAAHAGHQVGLELLLMIPRLGVLSGFAEISVNEELEPVFPERFLDAEVIAEYTKALAPPPRASADEIVTPMGGTFYAREAPHLPVLVDDHDHFEVGQPLFIIEVMKMFNKVLAPFSGTIIENHMKNADGTIVHKGQVIFRIEPDERIEEESDEQIAARVREATLALL
ncbi:MAG: biotin/lipoyl-containing protein [Myxococcota bacterium]